MSGGAIGPASFGGGASYGRAVTSNSPAMRKTTVREVFTFSHAPDQVGLPATMHNDASPGYSRKACRSAAAAMDVCDAGIFEIIRSVGTTSGAHSGPRTGLSRHCCDPAMRVALPPTYACGEFNPLEARGLARWKTDGLGVHRPLAASRNHVIGPDGPWARCSHAWLIVGIMGLGGASAEYVRAGTPYPREPLRESSACA